MMKNYTFREVAEGESFDPNILCENVPFTQAGFYGEWQKKIGRTVKRFVVSGADDSEKVVAYFQIIKFPLLFGKNYLYIPYGPVTKDESESFLSDLKKELIHIAKKENAVFVRLDFTPSIATEVLSKHFTKAPAYTYHSSYFQPRVEWFLGLDKTEEEIFQDMHEKTRYSIRTSEKRGIKTELVTEDFEKYFDVFYRLMSTTSERNHFGLHSKKYYENIFRNLSKENSYLLIAKFEGKVLAIDVVMVFGGVANYVFGASSDEERTRLPAYLGLWKAICYAKKIGCEYYNFGGITPENDDFKGWDGLTKFKKRFGGKEVKHSDFFDVIVSPFWYHLYNFRKRIKNIKLFK